ncbi:MAG: PAS domain S-box protein [Rubricoccaceae bacterium]|nr:PAS domain S-box protein [Rubricoccaceae bacterium]
MITPLQVLYVASEGGYTVKQALEQAGYAPEITKVVSIEDVLSEMNKQTWDAVIVDKTDEPCTDILSLVAECPETPALVCLVRLNPEQLNAIKGRVYCTENLGNLGALVARALRGRTEAEVSPKESLPDPQRSKRNRSLVFPALVTETPTRQLADHLPIGLYQSTPDGRILYANEAMVDLLGYSSLDEIANLDIEDVGYPHDQFVVKMEQEGEVRDHVIKWTDRRGRTKYTRENVRTVRDDNGLVLYFEGTMEDITETREREEKDARHMARSLAQQKALVELSSLPGNDVEIMARRATEVMAQHAETARAVVFLADNVGDDVRCLSVYSLQDAEHASEPIAPFSAYMPTFGIFERERCLSICNTEADPRVEEIGATSYFRERNIGATLVAPIRRRGDVIGIVAIQHVGGARTWTVSEADFVASVGDLIAITLERAETAEAEHALRESEARYRAFSELASDYAFGLNISRDGNDEIVWATEAFSRITGYSREELDALDGLLSIVHPSMADKAQAAFARAIDGEDIDVELKIVTKDGDNRWVNHRARRMANAERGTVVLYNSGQDITVHKQFEAELIEAKEEALEMARMKSVFLANMSHEIRTPLTGILGFADLLIDEAEGEAREFAQSIAESGNRLMNTLNSVLDMARIEANRVDLKLEIVDLVQEARQAVSAMEPLANDKGLTLSMNSGNGRALAKLDRGCVCRVFTNLVGNAIKFTEEGEVSIDIEPAEDTISIHIRDTGVGIDESFLPHLFDEFRQETSGQERIHEGAGLGLAISKRLIDLMGGTISVETKRPGGTVFSVEFERYHVSEPFQAAGDGARVPEREEQIIIRPVERTEPFSDRGELSAESVEEVEPTSDDLPAEKALAPFTIDELILPGRNGGADSSTRKNDREIEEHAIYRAEPEVSESRLHHVVESRMEFQEPGQTRDAGSSDQAGLAESDSRQSILVVEDNPDTRMLLERIISQEYQVSAVGDARSALMLLNTNQFDGLVLDINLGGKETGVDILRIARSLPGYESIYAISLTAYALPGDRERFLEAGFNRYVSKPFTRSTLMSALADGLGELAEA